ncbi:MAG: tetratricopeptide repeat protein [Bdellovibrionales bacterium]
MQWNFRRKPVLGLLFILFCLWCWQVYWWRHQAVQITHFQMKSFFHLISVAERLEWGAICNGLQDYTCAAEVFGALLAKQPKHRLALSNYAIAEAQRHQCHSALKLFDRYRAGGPEGPETLYWRGRCLMQQKRWDEARATLYLSATLSPDATQAPEALVDLLFQQNLNEEAFSVVAALTGGRPSRSPRWRAKFADMVVRHRVQATEIDGDTQRVRRALRLPCLDGHNFWMPVQFAAEASPEFVTIDPEQPTVSLNQEQLMPRQPAQQGGETKLLSALQIGPWIFRDVHYEICENCNSVVGRSLLENFEVSEDMEASVRFLILTPL